MNNLISRLSEIRSQYNCFDEAERPYYHALSEAIEVLSGGANGDTISRQAAIDAVKRLSLGETDATRLAMRIGDYLKRLPSAQPEPQWIQCSERLPEEKDAGILKKLGTNRRSDHVIATIEVKGERMTWLACTYDGVWHWDQKYAFPDFKVVAWIPLPEPYRGGKE